MADVRLPARPGMATDYRCFSASPESITPDPTSSEVEVEPRLSVMLYILVASPWRYRRHSTRDLSTSTIQRIPTANTPRPSRNVNGMLVLPERSMMADDTNGPINEEVLPIIENSAKKRNCSIECHT